MLTVEEAHEITSIPEPHRFICCNTLAHAATLLKPQNVARKLCFGLKLLQRGPSGSEQPLLGRMKVSLIGEMSPGRRVLGAACLNEGSTPEVLLTSQVRKSWDTLHSSEASCFSPFLLAREQAKEMIPSQQWLWLPTCPTGTLPCVTLHCT